MAAALHVASTAGSVPLRVESIARSVMNFDALLGDELMLARVAVRYHVVHAAHAVSMCLCVQCVVMVACVAGSSIVAFSTVAAGGGKPPYVHVFCRCVHYLAHAFSVCGHDCVVLTFLVMLVVRGRLCTRI